MTDARVHSVQPTDPLRKAPECAESQADGVPCPTLGRSCENCERAQRDQEREAPLPLV